MANFVIAAVTLVIVVVVYYATQLRRRYKYLPPGPYGLPLVGYVPFMGTKPYLTFKQLAEKYGSVFSVSVGTTTAVVVNDFESMKEILVRQGESFNGRPDLLTLDVIFKRKDIASAEGPAWKVCKRFTMQVLRDFGMGRSSLESVVMVEVDKLTQQLRAQSGQKVEMSSVFFCPILNVIWRIAANRVFDPTDSSMDGFKKAFQDVSCNSNVGVVNTFPFLRFVAPDAIGYKSLTDGVDKIYGYLAAEIDEHERRFVSADLKDFTDIYLAEIGKHNGSTKEPFTSKTPSICIYLKKESRIGCDRKKVLIRNSKRLLAATSSEEEYLMGTLLNLFLGGVGTLETTLHWAALLMALHPQIQRKVQQELDAAVSDDSFLSQSSKAMIPYTEATLLEIQRFASIVPFAMPHCTTKDVVLKGYRIPSRTFVFPNLWAVHHDEHYWKDPSVFRPDRFLTEDGFGVVKHDCFLPFGSGSRSCPGEALAKLELFLFYTSLVRRFSFDVVPDEPRPSLEPVFGVTLQPQPYSLLVRSR